MKKIAVLMAVFRPNLGWLEEQLASLEAQTWENIELWIWDDSPEQAVGELFFSEHLHRIPFHYRVGQRNMGTDRTFAVLTECAAAEYIAYCDQDDIWEPAKLEKLAHYLEQSEAQAAYCGLSVIDRDGKMLEADIRRVRRRDQFPEGEDLACGLLIKNSIYGCSMLVRASIAQSSLPLPQGMHYDHWISLWAALHGRLSFVDEPLVKHRLHDQNISAPLRGIRTKQDYYEQRVLVLHTRIRSVLDRLSSETKTQQISTFIAYLQDVFSWAQARQDCFEKKPGARNRLWCMRHMSMSVSLFEMCLPFIPQRVFPCVMRGIARFCI